MVAPSCQDCGTPVVTGVRCRPCNGKHIKLVYAERLQAADTELLRLVNTEGLTPGRLGKRLGVSRVAADSRIKGARKRLALLEVTS